MARVRTNALGWTALLATVPLWWGAYWLTAAAWRTWPSDSAGVVAARSMPPLPKAAPKPYHSQCEELRDPFQRAAFVEEPCANVPRFEFSDRPKSHAIATRFGLNDLRFVAAKRAGRALVIDPEGSGWIARAGDLLGKAEAVGRASIRWRVDRIRDRDVVLVREDPAHPEIPSVSKTVTMRSE